MITAQQLVQAGIFPEADCRDALWSEAALSWLRFHTTLPIEKIDGEILDKLPAGAKLFLQKYRDLMERAEVVSESIDGLSQRFSEENIQSQLLKAAQSLMPEYFNTFRFIPKIQHWKY